MRFMSTTVGRSDEPVVRVLIVEDDVKLAGLVRRGLRDDGMAADVAIKGEDALWMAEATAYDVLVLDLMLPGIDGFETCRRLRGDGVRTPILMLTARDAVEDRIAGLDTGADDYLAKPFDFGELLARLRALARRGPAEHGPLLRVGRGATEIPLSTKEFQLLEVFMRHPGEVLSRFQLLEGAWDTEYEHRSNVIDVYVRYLREKVDRPFGVATLETVRGAGYRLRQG
jgi:two-component system OmpR family response regulator